MERSQASLQARTLAGGPTASD
ncbi:uncharacterized, partial [Tachysurus ichikawai]